MECEELKFSRHAVTVTQVFSRSISIQDVISVLQTVKPVAESVLQIAEKVVENNPEVEILQYAA